jgi:hypothetical protein
LDVVLASGEFFRWIDESGYERPTFWVSPLEERGEHTKAAGGAGPGIKITEQQPRGKKSGAAWEALNALYPDGPPENLQTSLIHRRVEWWIKQHLKAKYPFTNVSREVVARLLGRK